MEKDPLQGGISWGNNENAPAKQPEEKPKPTSPETIQPIKLASEAMTENQIREEMDKCAGCDQRYPCSTHDAMLKNVAKRGS